MKEQVEALMPDFKVWVTNIETIEDNYYFLKTLETCLIRKKRLRHSI